MSVHQDYYKATLVDFPDDCELSVYGPNEIDSMMKLLKEMGFTRVYWIHYGDASYEFFWKAGMPGWEKMIESIAQVNEPIEFAVKSAHKYGMELFALIKPYENGISLVYPQGSPLAAELGELPHIGGSLPALMKFVREHPDLRIKRRMDDIPANLDELPIQTITLYKTDAAPTRITKENIQIWTSDDNFNYSLSSASFDLIDQLAPVPHDFIDLKGNMLAEQSQMVRAITLENLNIRDRFIIISTSLIEGEADFSNSAQDMVKVYTDQKVELPISIGIEHNVWSTGEFNFVTSGIVFDDGFGKRVIQLDKPGAAGKGGFIAITRGRNEYLPTALCEAYPEVRDFWLKMVKECLDAGVDGVDFRIENHSTHTNDPFAYGFNEIIIEEYTRRHGVITALSDINLEQLADIRGEFYTAFLRDANQMIKSYGKKMLVHLNVEFFRPDPPINRRLAYPWNIKFAWKQWIEEGLLDEAMLRSFTFTPDFVLNDPFSNEMIEACQEQKIPIHYTRYCSLQPPEQFAHDMKRIAEDGRFESIIVYEVAAFMRANEQGAFIFDEKLGDVIRKG